MLQFISHNARTLSKQINLFSNGITYAGNYAKCSSQAQGLACSAEENADLDYIQIYAEECTPSIDEA